MRRECKYAMKAREHYQETHDKNELITTVWRKCRKYAKGNNVVERSSKALISLCKGKDKNSWIVGKQILSKANIENYCENKSYGLWPWLEKTGAGVIQESGDFPESSYKIKQEFFSIFIDIIGAGKSRGT